MKLFLVLMFYFAHADDGLNFLVLGDWGGLPTAPFSTDIENGTSKQMSIIADKYKVDFVVALGDNFYFDGIENEHDPRFEQTFQSVFNEPSLQVPWYLIAGNHDHHGNVSGQIAYSSHMKFWNFPDFWYSKKWTLPNSSRTLQLVMLDTIILCGNTGYDDSLMQPSGPKDEKLSENQWNWLEQQLASSKADYLIVGGHFPVWSIGEHGPTKCLVKRLKPLLEKYNVTAYLNGHDHNLQHLVDTGIHYFVIGASNFIQYDKRNAKKVPKDSLQFFWADESKLGSFALINVSNEFLKLSMIDSSGLCLHEQTMQPRNI
ncbi:tartrate-resistant acid phosphatase type 5 isoform X2 [Hydra vulgaris]|uniref:Tartrate-resistant acid phosphatase type 5 n=1 Tax=Hydra vulgaris TaxID=6087 RepID=A0ABM4D648_HYDVU